MESDFLVRLWTNSPLVNRTQAQSLQTHGQSTPSVPERKAQQQRGHKNTTQSYSNAADFVLSNPFLYHSSFPAHHYIMIISLLETICCEQICWNCFHARWGCLVQRDQILAWRNTDSTTSKEREILVTANWFCWGHEGGVVLWSCIFSALLTADVLAGQSVATWVDFVYQNQKCEVKSGLWRPLISELLLSWHGRCAQRLCRALAILQVWNLVLVSNNIRSFVCY